MPARQRVPIVQSLSRPRDFWKEAVQLASKVDADMLVLRKAGALSEFIAWTLANQNLATPLTLEIAMRRHHTRLLLPALVLASLSCSVTSSAY